MAIYLIEMKSFGRSGGKRGSRATHAAAYRAGERIRDERTGALYNHTRRQDVLHKEVILPAGLSALGAEMDWARERERLWNAAEHAEIRRNARVAREYTLALPHELAHEQRLQLARGFAQELADRYHNAVDLVLHAPRHDARNFHAHLLSTTREITPEGLGPKTTMELSDATRLTRGLSPGVEELRYVRERWAMRTNDALRDAHLEIRVSHLSLQAQGLDRDPVHVSMAAWYKNREAGEGVLARRTQHSLEEIRAQARKDWLAMRSQERERTAVDHRQEHVRGSAALESEDASELAESHRRTEHDLER